MNFKRTNNIVGWVVCIIACTVYIMTMEATGSLWDCGEFISSAYKVQVPHPPGAPLFVLLGRLFTMFLKPSQAALGVNLMSALSSGFTILFLFWTITHFARRLMVQPGELISREKMTAIMGAGVVGALAYTFSDSFWFSAVEGEVYAMSSLFTAIVFWAILKWEHEADEPYADRCDAYFGHCGDARAYEVDMQAGFEPTGHDQLIVRWHKPLDPVRRRALVAKAHAIGAF